MDCRPSLSTRRQRIADLAMNMPKPWETVFRGTSVRAALLLSVTGALAAVPGPALANAIVFATPYAHSWFTALTALAIVTVIEVVAARWMLSRTCRLSFLRQAWYWLLANCGSAAAGALLGLLDRGSIGLYFVIAFAATVAVELPLLRVLYGTAERSANITQVVVIVNTATYALLFVLTPMLMLTQTLHAEAEAYQLLRGGNDLTLWYDFSRRHCLVVDAGGELAGIAVRSETAADAAPLLFDSSGDPPAAAGTWTVHLLTDGLQVQNNRTGETCVLGAGHRWLAAMPVPGEDIIIARELRRVAIFYAPRCWLFRAVAPQQYYCFDEGAPEEQGEYAGAVTLPAPRAAVSAGSVTP